MRRWSNSSRLAGALVLSGVTLIAWNIARPGDGGGVAREWARPATVPVVTLDDQLATERVYVIYAHPSGQVDAYNSLHGIVRTAQLRASFNDAALRRAGFTTQARLAPPQHSQKYSTARDAITRVMQLASPRGKLFAEVRGPILHFTTLEDVAAGREMRAMRDSITSASLRERLATPAPMTELDEVPLEDALEAFARAYGIDVRPDWQSLNRAGLMRAAPVNFRMHGGDAGLVLEQLLSNTTGGRAAPRYRVEGERVIVFAPEKP